MKRVFGVKKDKEPPPSVHDASDRVPAPFPSLKSPFFFPLFEFKFFYRIKFRKHELNPVESLGFILVGIFDFAFFIGSFDLNTFNGVELMRRNRITYEKDHEVNRWRAL